MKPPPTTGPIVPGWIREQIARHEGDWPRAVLACGTAAAILVTFAMGVWIWTSEAVVYYGRP